MCNMCIISTITLIRSQKYKWIIVYTVHSFHSASNTKPHTQTINMDGYKIRYYVFTVSAIWKVRSITLMASQKWKWNNGKLVQFVGFEHITKVKIIYKLNVTAGFICVLYKFNAWIVKTSQFTVEFHSPQKNCGKYPP